MGPASPTPDREGIYPRCTFISAVTQMALGAENSLWSQFFGSREWGTGRLCIGSWHGSEQHLGRPHLVGEVSCHGRASPLPSSSVCTNGTRRAPPLIDHHVPFRFGERFRPFDELPRSRHGGLVALKLLQAPNIPHRLGATDCSLSVSPRPYYRCRVSTTVPERRAPHSYYGITFSLT